MSERTVQLSPWALHSWLHEAYLQRLDLGLLGSQTRTLLPVGRSRGRRRKILSGWLGRLYRAGPTTVPQLYTNLYEEHNRLGGGSTNTDALQEATANVNNARALPAIPTAKRCPLDARHARRRTNQTGSCLIHVRPGSWYYYSRALSVSGGSAEGTVTTSAHSSRCLWANFSTAGTEPCRPKGPRATGHRTDDPIGCAGWRAHPPRAPGANALVGTPTTHRIPASPSCGWRFHRRWCLPDSSARDIIFIFPSTAHSVNTMAAIGSFALGAIAVVVSMAVAAGRRTILQVYVPHYTSLSIASINASSIDVIAYAFATVTSGMMPVGMSSSATLPIFWA